MQKTIIYRTYAKPSQQASLDKTQRNPGRLVPVAIPAPDWHPSDKTGTLCVSTNIFTHATNHALIFVMSFGVERPTLKTFHLSPIVFYFLLHEH